uniref:Integrase core domain containing protein n=1 Tax=Solanum tuberosum TaxID=4113 RepID=M1E0W8_SOLTU
MVWCKGLRTPSTVRRYIHGPWMVSVDPKVPQTVDQSTDRRSPPWMTTVVVIDVFTVSQYDEENILIGSPAGSASGSEAGSTSCFESAHASGSESSHASGSEYAHASRSNAKSASGSRQNEQAASSDEATSSKSVLAPRNKDPTLVAGTYSEAIVRELYASYAATLRGSISKRSKPIAQDPLMSTMVRDGEHVEWVATPQLGIKKATLNFVAKFFWLLVRNRVSPTKANNQLTWDRAVMVVALVAVLEIDFARMLLAETHERAFKTSTTYPFPCLIFQLCRDSGVPIWHCDRLIQPTGTLDIGLIRNEANVAAPRREPQVEIPHLGADLANTMGQAQGGDHIIPDHTNTVPASSSQASSRAPSSSRSTLPLGAIVVQLAKVQKLEAQMATLLHHIQPCMQKSIAESEARMERRMEGILDQKIQDTELASLWADVDAILATSTVEPQAALTALADDTVLEALFSGTAEEAPETTHTKGKRHHSSRTEEEKSQKKQRRQDKEARKASILDEELRQQRLNESVAGASSSTPVVEVPPVMRDIVSTTDGAVRVTKSTTEGAMMDDVGTTEGDPSMVPAGSGKPDPPICS